ncbi:DUF3011 domain-containing protein [Lysobacter niastensis]|uniref:DUF3011 domain-containing protein n=1 Tax=Lysobacter niastensis TaxID=380629 RepID=A0ABS0B9L8_9GAMM|nr:DUF3011 domain-containing protein [Lysobacter niastensis]MBF6025685.1 DUF3011 domain-containing protein [Lysobacter niastensis]
MTTRWKHTGWAFGLTLLTIPAAAHIGRDERAFAERRPMQAAAPLMLADATSGRMLIGLTIVSPQEQASDAPLPEPASLGYPASRNAVLCHSDDHGYRECMTPFHGRVSVSREVSSTRCIENRNWGWREGAVWVDQGCGAVFVRVGAN